MKSILSNVLRPFQAFILNKLGYCDNKIILEWLLEFLYVEATLLAQRCLPLCDHHFSLMEQAVENCIVEIATKDCSHFRAYAVEQVQKGLKESAVRDINRNCKLYLKN
jgi:hypothetical protein